MLTRDIFAFNLLSHDVNLEVQEYYLIRADHPSNVKRGGVCLYDKNHLPLKLININFLLECLTIELNIKNKLCVLVALYRSPSQSHNEFSSFVTNSMTQYGLTQIIHEPTHILEFSVFYTDLVFNSQENLVTNSQVHSSLHLNCHYQIAFYNLNLKIYYTPPYERLIWKYEKPMQTL